MRQTLELPYKTSRKAAGYTQQQALEFLCVADTTLSSYENGANVPDDVVDRMCQLYNDPLLAYWHLQHTTALGMKYLPPILRITSGGEMAFQSIVAQSKINPTVESITQIMSDGIVRLTEAQDWAQDIEALKDITSRLYSVLLFSWKIKVEKEKHPQRLQPL